VNLEYELNEQNPNAGHGRGAQGAGGGGEEGGMNVSRTTSLARPGGFAEGARSPRGRAPLRKASGSRLNENHATKLQPPFAQQRQSASSPRGSGS